MSDLHLHNIYTTYTRHIPFTRTTLPKNQPKCQQTNEQETKKVKTEASLSSSNLFFIHLMLSHAHAHSFFSLSLSLCDLTPEPAWDCKSISSSVQYVTLQNIYLYIYIYISHIQV
jgi:hypothetical protein